MPISHWTSVAARRTYEDAYSRSLRLWPVPSESVMVVTPFGTTHVIRSGAMDGPPVVLLHAASLSATQWYPQAADLGATYRLHAVDLMGDVGLSTQKAPLRTRDDAAAWLAALLDRLGIEKAVFVGSSFGGFHSANFAIRRPERVAALVLLGPAATIKRFKLAVNLMIRVGGWFPLPASVRPALRSMMHGKLPDERIVQQMERGVAGFRYDRAGIYPAEMPAAELATIGCPALILVGDKEMIYNPQQAVNRARQLIPAAETEIVPGAGHLLGMEQPTVINQRILAFLAAHHLAPPPPSRRKGERAAR